MLAENKFILNTPLKIRNECLHHWWFCYGHIVNEQKWYSSSISTSNNWSLMLSMIDNIIILIQIQSLIHLSELIFCKNSQAPVKACLIYSLPAGLLNLGGFSFYFFLVSHCFGLPASKSMKNIISLQLYNLNMISHSFH